MKSFLLSFTFLALTAGFLWGQTTATDQNDSNDISAMNFICPVDSGKITYQFGNRTHPILKVTRHHDGLDIQAPTGRSVYATADGEIVYAGMLGGYGKTVKIKHGEIYQTMYGHLNKIFVRVGQKVRKGEKIGVVGNTGISTVSHLHYEIRKNGTPVDPLKLFSSERLTY